MATSYASAQASGIVTGASDQTAAINGILGSSAYSGIVFDLSTPGAITINGTINAQGKVIQFLNGNYLTSSTGTGILDSAQISAGYSQKCFDTSIALTRCLTSSKMFSVMWYGAKGDGVAADDVALQKSSDTVIANATMTRDLYLPPGKYSTTKPWILYNWNGTNYTQFTINVIGDYNVQNSNLVGVAQIIPTFGLTFAIGVQQAYCGMIFGVAIEGLVTGLIGNPSFDTFVNTSYSSVISGHSISNSTYSPYAGIVIDPFTNGGIPPDGGYIGYNASATLNWYRGTGANSGTTGFKISNCLIQGFSTDICYSPNGLTQQGEDCIVELCQLNFANVAIAYCQSQSDNCFATGIRSWYYLWTVFDNATYGNQKGCIANISRVNVAGVVNTIFNIVSNKSFLFDKIFAESFFAIGLISAGATGGLVTGSTFNFSISLTNLQPKTHLTLQNVEINSSNLRYYDDLFNKRLRITSRNGRFVNCFFDLPPYIYPLQNQSQYNTATFENCPVLSYGQILGMQNDMYSMATAQFTPVLYGNFKTQNDLGLDTYSATGGNPLSPTLTFEYNCTSFNRICANFAINVSITPNGSRTATFTSSYYLFAQVNDIVVDPTTGNVLGRISVISTTTITITEIPVNIVAGTYTLELIYYLTANNPIIGDISNGSASITNVSQMFGGYINSLAAGFRFDHPAFPKGTYIVSYNSSTHTLTMSSGSNKTATRQNFINGNPEVEIRSVNPPNSSYITTFATPLPSGTRWLEMVTALSSSKSSVTTWIFNKGGYLNAAALGLTSAFQSDFNIEPLIRNNAGVIQYYDTYSDAWINV
jgi:hypothetical protein